MVLRLISATCSPVHSAICLSALYLAFSPHHRLVFKSSLRPIRLLVARICYHLTGPRNKPTNQQTNKQIKMVFLANCSLCMFYSTLSFFCLNRSCNIQACIYIFYFILFVPLMIKLYRRVFFFVKLPPVIEPQQCKEIVCSRNKRNKNWVCCLLFISV